MIIVIIILVLLGGLFVLAKVRYKNYIKSELKIFVAVCKYLIPTAKVFHIGETTECVMKKVYLKHCDMLDFKILFKWHHEDIKLANGGFNPFKTMTTIIPPNAKFNEFSKSLYL